jgi:hypothetical protein
MPPGADCSYKSATVSRTTDLEAGTATALGHRDSVLNGRPSVTAESIPPVREYDEPSGTLEGGPNQFVLSASVGIIRRTRHAALSAAILASANVTIDTETYVRRSSPVSPANSDANR